MDAKQANRFAGPRQLRMPPPFPSAPYSRRWACVKRMVWQPAAESDHAVPLKHVRADVGFVVPAAPPHFSPLAGLAPG